MAAIITYKGLNIVSPHPTGLAGQAFNLNFKAIADDLEQIDTIASDVATLAAAIEDKQDKVIGGPGKLAIFIGGGELGASDIPTNALVTWDRVGNGADQIPLIDQYGVLSITSLSSGSIIAPSIVGSGDLELTFNQSEAGRLLIQDWGYGPVLEADHGVTDLYGDGSLRIRLDEQGIGFFGTSTAGRASATADIKDALTAYGLLQGTSATPLNLDGGRITAGSATIAGNTLIGTVVDDGVNKLQVAGSVTASGYRVDGEAGLTATINVGTHSIVIVGGIILAAEEA